MGGGGAGAGDGSGPGVGLGDAAAAAEGLGITSSADVGMSSADVGGMMGGAMGFGLADVGLTSADIGLTADPMGSTTTALGTILSNLTTFNEAAFKAAFQSLMESAPPNTSMSDVATAAAMASMPNPTPAEGNLAANIALGNILSFPMGMAFGPLGSMMGSLAAKGISALGLNPLGGLQGVSISPMGALGMSTTPSSIGESGFGDWLTSLFMDRWRRSDEVLP